MREFNQVILDARLAEIAGNLTPEQAIRVNERVRARISSANLDVTSIVGSAGNRPGSCWARSGMSSARWMFR